MREELPSAGRRTILENRTHEVLFEWKGVIKIPMALYQPVDVMFVDVETTAELSCVSSEHLEAGTGISWYRKSWRTGGNISLVKSCALDNGQNKYVCSNRPYTATLQIRNTQTSDSGDYICTSHIDNIIGNGTALVVRDKTTSGIFVHLLNPHQHPHLNNHLSSILACVVHNVPHAIYITWNVSGRFSEGKMTSIQRSYGRWTFMNIISLPKGTLKTGGQVTCEVQFNSSTIVVVHWQNTGKHWNNFASDCQNYLMPVVTLGLVLLLTLFSHLIWIYKRSDKFSNIPTDKNRSQDEITYAQLNMYELNKGRK
ncbi:uncharacterized protein [Dendrobates tinctorius]|uniref:uncharacterized protein isoform X2 n=1 Tax=Dendrobates tinctorius TaxID=92724 RepID=UPI003CC94D35